ncbi:RNA polymerase sigma factor [Streptomyces sp. BE20]|uniref:RNA polymerase sigma factor n=1 Tax=Streptomyces sp. BE20 TaxID=3002525 RepID=UPI002E7758C0|nr:RNA polymerase sigma factor [Streptomyces sp. BE20]MEE1824616.1 RNA polymerase sigma factor [Streptomyces sp. BE20]
MLPRLHRAAVQLTGNSFGAGDVVHDAYLRIARRPDRFLRHPQPYAYAFTTMVNILRDEWRRDRRRTVLSEAAEDAYGGPGRAGRADASGGGVGELQAHWEVVRLLGCLTVKQARAVLLIDLDGYSLEEAARLLGVHRSTLAVTRRRALARLRAVLERESGPGSGAPPPGRLPAPRDGAGGPASAGSDAPN